MKDLRALANNPTEMDIPPDGSAARLRPNLELSEYRSLRELRFSAASLIPTLYHGLAAVKDSFQAMTSGLTSPLFSNAVVDYGPSSFCSLSPGHIQTGSESDWYYKHFEVFRAMHQATEYKLVLIAKWVSDDSLQELERATRGLPSQIEVLHIPAGTEIK